jgi:hypothetical protein
MSKTAVRIGGVLAAMAFIGACASATIRPDGGEKLSGEPAYKESKNYFWWGLKGEHDINVAEICKDKGVDQMQSQFTFFDGFKTAITLGIWAPKTAKVWCK